jgi:PAS domain S-box-containing protein
MSPGKTRTEKVGSGRKTVHRLEKKEIRTGKESKEQGTTNLILELKEQKQKLDLQNKELKKARSKAEELAEKYYSLYDFSPIGYLTVSFDGRITGANLHSAKMLGKARSGLKNNNLGFFISEDTRPVFNEFLEDLRKSKTRNTCEVALKTKDNTPVYVLFAGHITDQGHECQLTMVDITERKQLDEKILNTIALTEEKERAYFSSEIHDNLGPLLSATNLYLQMAQRAASVIIQRENIKKAEELIRHAFEIVNEISDKLSPHFLRDFGLLISVRRFLEKIEETSNIRITFRTNLTEKLKGEIEAVTYRTIIEFVTNTMKHAKANKVLILLTRTDSTLRLSYRDDGIGFDVEEIFSYEKGFGLINIRNQIQTLGGDIKMASEPGKGVDYLVSLKLE